MNQFQSRMLAEEACEAGAVVEGGLGLYLPGAITSLSRSLLLLVGLFL